MRSSTIEAPRRLTPRDNLLWFNVLTQKTRTLMQDREKRDFSEPMREHRQITDQEHQEDSKRGLSSISTCGPDLQTSRKDETGLRLKTPQRARRLPATNARPAITTSTPPTAAHAQAGNPPADEDASAFFPDAPDEEADPAASFSAVISTP